MFNEWSQHLVKDKDGKTSVVSQMNSELINVLGA